MYRILTHYVQMETYEVPDELVAFDEEGNIDEDKTFENILNKDEDYVIQLDSRDFEIVSWEKIKE